MQHDVCATDPPRAQTAGCHPGVELVAVAGGQLPQQDVTEFRDEMVVDDALPVLGGGGRKTSGGHELAEQHPDRRLATTLEARTGRHDHTLQFIAGFASGPTDRPRQPARYATHRIGIASHLQAPTAGTAFGHRSCS